MQAITCVTGRLLTERLQPVRTLAKSRPIPVVASRK